MSDKTRFILWLNVALLTAFTVSSCTGLLFRYAFPAAFFDEDFFVFGLGSMAWADLHKIAGLFVLGGVTLHLILHWKWIVSIGRRFFGKTSRQARINFMLDALLFWVFLLSGLSGLVLWLAISDHIKGGIWIRMHQGTGTAMVLYVAFHLALHWKWIVSMTGRTGREVLWRLRLGATGCHGISL